MDKYLVHNVKEEAIPKMKINPVKPSEDDPSVTFYKVPKKFVQLEDVSDYIRRKIETIG